MVFRIGHLCFVFFVCFGDVLTENEFERERHREAFRHYLKKKMYAEHMSAAEGIGHTVSSTTGISEEHNNSSLSSVGIITPPKYADKSLQTKEDHHKYYNTSFIINPEEAMLHWIDMDKLSEEQVIVHSMLSGSHRQAATISLTFDFPFYGHVLRNITLATGGFIYMGDYLHNWIAATQYVAPLMANFDTSISSDSFIKYADNGSSFTIQWDKVYIHDRENDGSFTFQVTLFNSGDIVFTYKQIPFPISEISDEKHPVTVGISDAYITDQTIYYFRKKTIVEYHKINKMSENVSSGTAIYFSALPTCLGYHHCQSCMSSNIGFNCLWCEAVQRCSDGVDRYHQDWIKNGCEKLGEKIVCPKTKEVPIVDTTTSSSSSVTFPTQEPNSLINFSTPTTPRTTAVAPKTTAATPKTTAAKTVETNLSALPITTVLSEINSAKSEYEVKAQSTQEEMKEMKTYVQPGIIILITIVVSLMICLGMWLFYAYRFPQSLSGQFLIKYRPHQWNFKWGENDGTSNSGNI